MADIHVIILLFLLHVSKVDEFQCVTGLLEEAYISRLSTTDRISFAGPGLYVFPTVKFQCNGRIESVSGIAHFEDEAYYNRNLLLNINVWRRDQRRYAPTGISKTVTLSLDDIASEHNLTDGLPKFYFSNVQSYVFSISLGDASISVMAGDILGIYLPWHTDHDEGIIQYIPIGLVDNFKNLSLLTSCSTPMLGNVECDSVSLFETSLLSFNFVSTSVNGKHINFVWFAMYACNLY